jgi:hypothetical protein
MNKEGKLNWKDTCFCKQKKYIKNKKIHLIKYFYILEFKAYIYFHYTKLNKTLILKTTRKVMRAKKLVWTHSNTCFDKDGMVLLPTKNGKQVRMQIIKWQNLVSKGSFRVPLLWIIEIKLSLLFLDKEHY